MRLEAKTDEELAIMSLLPEGVYQFEVVGAEDLQSKAGNDMIKLNIKIWDSNGAERLLFDYLLDKMPKKLKHFTDITGLQEEYKSMILPAEKCIGKYGHAKVVIQEDKSGKYGPRNSIVDYVILTAERDAPIKDEEFTDDMIPF